MLYKQSIVVLLLIMVSFLGQFALADGYDGSGYSGYDGDISDWKPVHYDLMGVAYPPNLYLGAAGGFAFSSWDQIQLPDNFVSPPVTSTDEDNTNGFIGGAFG